MSPPWNSTFLRKRSHALPSASRFRARASPAAGSPHRPPSQSIRPACWTVRSTSSRGPPALEALDGFLNLEEVADRAAQGLVHVGDHRRHPAAQACARGARVTGQGARLLRAPS